MMHYLATQQMGLELLASFYITRHCAKATHNTGWDKIPNTSCSYVHTKTKIVHSHTQTDILRTQSTLHKYQDNRHYPTYFI